MILDCDDVSFLYNESICGVVSRLSAGVFIIAIRQQLKEKKLC